jgi:CHAT domain-containing protein
MAVYPQCREPLPILRRMLFAERVEAFLFVILLLLMCSGHCVAQLARDLNLHLGKPVSVLLQQGEPIRLHLDPNGSEAEEIFLDTAAQGVSFQIASDDGTEIQSGRITTYGWAVIPLNLRQRGEIQFQLKIEDAVEGFPGIRVRAERLSIPASTMPAAFEAASAFSSAQSLHRSLHAEDLRHSIIRFQQAADKWSFYGDLYGEALALGGKGESLIELSRYQEALSTIDHALSLDVKSAYVRGWLNHLKARVYLDQWEPKPARPFAEETLRLGKEASDAALIALGHTDLLGVAFWNFDTDANKIDDKAYAEAIAAGVPETMGLERQWRAWLEENDEHSVRAVLLMSEAESYLRQAGDLRTALEVTGQIAQARRLTGDLYSALAKLLELESATKVTGNLVNYGILAENIGEIYFGLGKARFATTYYQLAEKAYAAASFQRGLMGIYGDLCETDLRTNRMSNAVADCRASLTLAEQTHEPVFIGSAEYRLGLADRKAGRLTQAFTNFTEAVRNSRVLNDRKFQSQERIQLGELLEQTGRPHEALAEFLQAKYLTQDVADPASLLEAQYSVAHWYAHNGQYENAHAELKPALDKIEMGRKMISDSMLQATYFAAERKCYELAVELRMREFERDPGGGGDALALELSEQSRARGLLDAQALKTSGREHGDVQASLIRSNIELDRAFDHRLKLLVDGGTKRDLQASAAELTHALGNLQRAEDAVHIVAGEVPKLAASMSTTALERASVSSGVTFFEYALGDMHSYLWVIGGGKRQSFVLPPREQLEEMVKQWRTLVARQGDSEQSTSAGLRHLSTDLSCALLPAAVEVGTIRMVIVPDGALAMLPFAALPEKSCSMRPGKPLVVNHEITATPSLSIFFSQKQKAESSTFQGQVAIIADPIFDAGDSRAIALKARRVGSGSRLLPSQETTVALPRLLNAGYEASAIQQVVTKAAGKDQVFLARGFDANLDTILSPAMRRYRIWHLATHGVYDESMPEFSGLVFSLVGPDGSPRFGFLKAQDIARLNVPAELVVLSACDSAAGENLSGEGVMGLSYSFLRAGAMQVISTLWSIDDAKSKDLMIAFYKEWIRNGGNAAAALRQSQLTVMRQSHSAAPYYWAGFQLTSLGE